jgi:outer membrane murein-binding lipoprotein Lpp
LKLKGDSDVTTPSKLTFKQLLAWALVGGITLLLAAVAKPAYQMAMMKQQLDTYAPELRAKVMALSPDTKAALKQVQAGHNRPSKVLTLRQVMQEILSDYQSIVAAVATDNAEQAADSARRLANHRIPKGGLLPYFPLDKINDTALSVLPAMNSQVEGSALRLATAADKGDMNAASIELGEIAKGCVACHQTFRGQPGVSAYIPATH